MDQPEQESHLPAQPWQDRAEIIEPSEYDGQRNRGLNKPSRYVNKPEYSWGQHDRVRQRKG